MGVTPRGIVLSRFALDYIKHAEQGGVIPKLLESSRTRFVSFLKETRRQSASGDRWSSIAKISGSLKGRAGKANFESMRQMKEKDL